MEILSVKEHEDGSATVEFDMTNEEILALFRLGVITALKKGIAEAKEYEPK